MCPDPDTYKDKGVEDFSPRLAFPAAVEAPPDDGLVGCRRRRRSGSSGPLYRVRVRAESVVTTRRHDAGLRLAVGHHDHAAVTTAAK